MFCNSLNHHLSFFPDKIDACCSGFQGPIYIKEPKLLDSESFEKIQALKEMYIKNFAENNIPEKCIGCHELKEGMYDGDYKINKLILNHFTHCNCKCIYCARINYYQRDFTEDKRKSDYYDILPIIKDLYAKNVIDEENLCVEFQGGDCSVLEEFEDIIDFLLQNKFKEILFTTNNIVYQPLIAKCLNLQKGMLITSLDCGTKETFKKIKQTDKFDDFVSNLIKYRENSNDYSFLLKYIVIRHINDNLEELTKFLNLLVDIDIKNVHFDVNYNDIMMNHGRKFVIPEHYYEMRDFCKDFCIRNNMNFVMTDYTQNIFNKGYFV